MPQNSNHKRLTASMLSGLDAKIRARDALLLQMNDALVVVHKDIESFLKSCALELGLDGTKNWNFNANTRTFHEVKPEK